MTLVRDGNAGHEPPGPIDADGARRDGSNVLRDITPAVLAAPALPRLRGVKLSRRPVVCGARRLGCPQAGISTMGGIERNYTDHAAAVGLEVPRNA